MNNHRVTIKERGLLKGAVRRVFARSELHRSVLEIYSVEFVDINRPRVKKWCYCANCGEVTPRYKMSVDHIEPAVPLNRPFEKMSMDEFIDRLWCEEHNLQVLCEVCHSVKSKEENKIRREIKKRS